MPIALLLFSYFGALLLSLGWLFLHRQEKNKALPNHRSSHVVPTPQGGGISIAVVGVITFWLLSLDLVFITQFVLLMSLCIVTLTGYWDDFHGLSGRWKLGLITLSILPLIFLMLTVIKVPFPLVGEVPLPFVLLLMFGAVLLCGLIWVVNLTNFMDGINGLAVSQTLFMLLALLWFREDFALLPSLVTWVLCLCAACLAFLPFNFPKARLFLGDTGSLFLGMLMAGLLLVMMLSHPNGLWVFLTLFAMFWVDATLTLVRRIWRGKSIFAAHRDHAYQHLANEYWQSHTKTTLCIMLFNVVWLLPMSHVVLHSVYPLLWLAIALLPVIIYATLLRAGYEC